MKRFGGFFVRRKRLRQIDTVFLSEQKMMS